MILRALRCADYSSFMRQRIASNPTGFQAKIAVPAVMNFETSPPRWIEG